jgi:hypothetical protein
LIPHDLSRPRRALEKQLGPWLFDD